MATNAAPIIIKRKKGGHDGGHHGGAWKVAYADFVTAMMAFFLLLWLLNSTTQEQRSGISEYFNPASVSRTSSGAGQILGGATITLDGPQKGRGAPLGLPVPAPEDKSRDSDAISEDVVEAGTKEERVEAPDNAGKNPDAPKEDLTGEQMQEIMRKREEKMFEEIEQTLKRTIEQTPELRKLAQNLIVERTEEGLRIQIVDQDRTSMFARGSAVPYQHTRQLIEMITRTVTGIPNKISISGHTDSTPYVRSAGYTNWELSSDRANAARREMLRYGLDEARLRRVVGRADTEPLLTDSPAAAPNRRLSITLLRQMPIPPKVGAEKAKPVPPPPVVKGARGITLPDRTDPSK